MNKTNPESDQQPHIYNQQEIVLEIVCYVQMGNATAPMALHLNQTIHL